MPIRINTVACSFLIALLWVSAAAADSEDPRAASERRWTPSLAFWSGITVQNQDATVQARCATGGPAGTYGTNQVVLPACSFPPFLGPADLRPPKMDDEDVVSPLVGASLQLLTPTLEFLPFRPRIFGSVELITFYSPQRKIAREGDPSGVRGPANISDLDMDGEPDPQLYPGIALGGVGSQTTSEVQLLSYGAKLGLAFPFELFGRRLWIKPAAGWTRYEVDVKGLTIHGIKDDLNPPPGFQWGANIRTIQLLGDDSLVLNGFGPGGELELEAGRIGPLGANIFFDLHAYRLFGDRNVKFSSSQSIPAGGGFGPDTYSASWSWEADPWLWRTAAGLRIQWLGR
jgi:hypothetical protein